MSITDELRKWAARELASWKMARERFDALTAIADRIDAEHQKAIRELNNLADASVLLPVDANNEYIRPGDVMEGYGKTIEVVELRYGRSGWVLISRDGNGYADTFAFVHHHEPTVEDVLDEFVAHWMDTHREDIPALKAEYAAKLQLRKDE